MHQRLTKGSLAAIYESLYPWNSVYDFVEQLKSTIAYKSEDNAFIALNKPFGVGIYNTSDTNTSKQNQDKLLSGLKSSPKYCIRDALKPLSDEFKSSEPYTMVKSIDRYASGLILISNDYETYRRKLDYSMRVCRSKNIPPYGFRAITVGYPVVGSNKISETVGMNLIEVDELGDYKEPIIVSQVTSKHRNQFVKDKRAYRVELEVKKTNRELSTALVEVFVSSDLHNFTRCYISSKTAFILGDVRFSKRIREILGKPIQVSAFKSSHRYDDSYEPLNSRLRNVLGVQRNASIPLMLDLHVLRLKNFLDRKKKIDLVIKSPYVPAYFALTAERLDLMDVQNLNHDTSNIDSDTVRI